MDTHTHKHTHMRTKCTTVFIKLCTPTAFLQVVSHRNPPEGTSADTHVKKISVSSNSHFYVKYINAVN